MKILAVETSCDDTGIAILEADNNGSFNILSNIVSSQIKVHKKYGGVYPVMAKREHQRNLVPVLKQALKEAKLLSSKPEHSAMQSARPNTQRVEYSGPKFQAIKNILEREPDLYKKLIPFLKKYEKPDTDLIAVTQGPGLEPCLWVGINFAKVLSLFWNIPIVLTNHIESHILVNFLQTTHYPLQTNKIFPAICLVVSGGHTQIILMKNPPAGRGKYKILGETKDDAAGECFDKCAKILGLGYPGGPEIAKLSKKVLGGRVSQYSKIRGGRTSTDSELPRPMINDKSYDFSFSGLKTAVLYEVKRKCRQTPLRSAFSKTTEGQQYIKQMCVEIQQAVIDVLIKKTIKAAKDYKVKTIILGGGVSANEELKKQFSYKLQATNYKLNFLVPPKNLSTDNALMTAITGYYHKKEKIDPSTRSGRFLQKIEAEANLRID